MASLRCRTAVCNGLQADRIVCKCRACLLWQLAVCPEMQAPVLKHGIAEGMGVHHQKQADVRAAHYRNSQQGPKLSHYIASIVVQEATHALDRHRLSPALTGFHAGKGSHA